MHVWIESCRRGESALTTAIGTKIRALRQALGLSQQQLAGKEMTRVFISLVESGKNTPSPENLRTIAHRLGKPVDYFLQDKADDEALNGAIVQMERARQALERGTAEDLAVSCETLQQVASHARIRSAQADRRTGAG